MAPPEQAGAIEEFDAVVLGSAVYMGQWMKPARELAARSAAVLAAQPVWLFSSGPVGESAKPADNPVDVTKILQVTKAREHRIFTGKLARKQLSFPDRAMASAMVSWPRCAPAWEMQHSSRPGHGDSPWEAAAPLSTR